MANKILKIVEKHENIVVVLGYGHVQEVTKYLTESNEELNVEVVN